MRNYMLLVAFALFACGASAREKTISTALATTDAARAAFVAFDATHQTAIVTKAPDDATGKAQLAAYRATQAKIVLGFVTVYRAIAIAATANNDQSLAGLLSVAGVLESELRDLGVLK